MLTAAFSGLKAMAGFQLLDVTAVRSAEEGRDDIKYPNHIWWEKRKGEDDEMNVRRFTCLLVTITLLVLTLAASPVVASTYYAASFWFTAEGKCLMTFNPHMVPGKNYSVFEYFEQAVGSFVFMGRSLVTDPVYVNWLNQYLYPSVDGTVKAFGWLKASWSHDEIAYGLTLFFYSLPHTVANMTSDPDIFMQLSPSFNLDLILGFKGTLKNGSMIEWVQGRCGFQMLGVKDPLGIEYTIAGFHIFSLSDGKDVEFWWSDRDLTVPIPDGSTMVVPAAGIFMHEVSVNPL